MAISSKMMQFKIFGEQFIRNLINVVRFKTIKPRVCVLQFILDSVAVTQSLHFIV